MIHDPVIEVTCDGEGCGETIDVVPTYSYNNYSGTSGQYDTEESDIEKQLERDGWFTKDGKQYCSRECLSITGDEEN